jgi:hypothetical protein
VAVRGDLALAQEAGVEEVAAVTAAAAAIAGVPDLPGEEEPGRRLHVPRLHHSDPLSCRAQEQQLVK